MTSLASAALKHLLRSITTSWISHQTRLCEALFFWILYSLHHWVLVSRGKTRNEACNLRTVEVPEGIEQDKPATLLSNMLHKLFSGPGRRQWSSKTRWPPRTWPRLVWKDREYTFLFLPFPRKWIDSVARVQIDGGTLVWTILIRQKGREAISSHS